MVFHTDPCGVLRSCPEIAELALAEMPSFRARRPRFTAMDTRHLSHLVGEMRPWPEALAEHVRARCMRAARS